MLFRSGVRSRADQGTFLASPPPLFDQNPSQWTPIDYFNNKVVCDLIEEKRPPGVFAALNDACATAHADPTAADGSFTQRLGGVSSPQFESRGSKFLIRHYACVRFVLLAGGGG